jgi:hypothetical protein
VHYFHDKTLLDRHLPLGKENILGLSGETEGVLARYRRPAGKDGKKAPGTAALLLIRYDLPEKAHRACRNLIDLRIPGAGEEGSGRTEGGRWDGARTMGGVLAAVLDASSRDRVQSLLDAVDRMIREQKRPKGEEE